MKNLSNENVIHIKKDKIEYIQFRKLLEYKNLKHCFTLKPLDFCGYDNYKANKTKVEKAYNEICKELDILPKDICRPKQTHTNKVEKILEGDEGIYKTKFDDVDGLTTNLKNKALVVCFADCTPLLFFDPIKNVIANTHSGWKGTLQTIGVKTVEKMREEYNCNPSDIICCIGPHIKKCHFEVDKEVRDLFYDKFKYLQNIEEIIKYNKEKDKFYIDTAKINKQILLNLGLKEKNIIDSNICTVCNSDVCHSFRVEKEHSGRAITIMELI